MPEPRLLRDCRFCALSTMPSSSQGAEGHGEGTVRQTPVLTSELPSSRIGPHQASGTACSLHFAPSVTQDLSCCHIQSQSQLPSLTCHSKDFKHCLALGDSDIYQWVLLSTCALSLKISHPPSSSNSMIFPAIACMHSATRPHTQVSRKLLLLGHHWLGYFSIYCLQ